MLIISKNLYLNECAFGPVEVLLDVIVPMARCPLGSDLEEDYVGMSCSFSVTGHIPVTGEDPKHQSD